MNTTAYAFDGWLRRVNIELARLLSLGDRTPMAVEVIPQPKGEVKEVCPHCGQSIVEMTPWDGGKRAV